MSRLLVLSRRELAALMRFEDYVDAVTEGFRMLAEGKCIAPAPLHIAVEDGGFHAKAASLPRGRGYVAVKVNSNFPDNVRRSGRPTIQGAVLLFDAQDGAPLALLDSIEITSQRTAAATAVAARHLARPDAETMTICGCGEQGRIQLVALRHVLPLRRVFAWDADRDTARAYARRLSAELDLEVVQATDLAEATQVSDAIVTCTTSTEAFLGREHVRPATFIAAIGADNPTKSEIRPELMAAATVVVDVLSQAIYMGDLHHAIAGGAMRADDVHAELGDLVLGRKPGRRDPDEITIFDSTGAGVQDVAAAARAYELARERGVDNWCSLG